MKNRVIRAGAAFVVFGLITSVLPNSGIGSVRADQCSSGSNPWKVIDPALIVGGAYGAYVVGTSGFNGGGSGTLYGAGKKKKSDNTTGQSDWDKMHSFIDDTQGSTDTIEVVSKRSGGN